MFDDFKNITGFDIEAFFRRFTSFITNQSQNIIDYYSGLVNTLDRDSYDEYQYLVEKSNFVINLFDLNQDRFRTVNYWQLMEFADDIRIKLETIGNFSKFARSSVRKESFTGDVTVQVSTRDNETIEEMIGRLGSNDRDNDWIDVALNNSLEQEDYITQTGGVVLSINFKNNSRFFVQGIIDNPFGERIKGLDIDKRIQFVNDDLKVLGYNDTLSQSMNILINLRKNDNPEFPENGIDPSLIVGMNVKSVAIPSIVRQLFQTFSTDDIVKQIQVRNTSFDEDVVKMDLNVVIKSGEEQKLILDL